MVKLDFDVWIVLLSGDYANQIVYELMKIGYEVSSSENPLQLSKKTIGCILSLKVRGFVEDIDDKFSPTVVVKDIDVILDKNNIKTFGIIAVESIGQKSSWIYSNVDNLNHYSTNSKLNKPN